jgi:hypothetical protein
VANECRKVWQVMRLVSPDLRVCREKDVLPHPFRIGVRILPCESVWQRHPLPKPEVISWLWMLRACSRCSFEGGDAAYYHQESAESF